MAVRKVFVLGATGGTGRHVVAQAVALGLEVTVLVRDPAKLPVTDRAVRVVTGDIRADSAVVRAAFGNQDAVISALGGGQSFQSAGLIAQAAPLIVAAMREQGVRRLVFTSAFGVGPTWQDTPLLPRIFVKTFLRDIYADKAAGEQAIKASALDWTIVYPVGLTNGPRTGTVRVGERLTLSALPRVSRADVAAVLVQQLDDPRFIRKGIIVAN
ncbi:MAG: NAD(P)-dependent oxidoreductase [Vicinamibacterales bacterium]